MAKIQSVEPNVADLANGWLKSYKLDYKLEQESLNTEIDQALNDYYADALYISLPVNEAGNPDYDKMAIIISAIHKLVIKDVVAYSNRKIKATKAVVK